MERVANALVSDDETRLPSLPRRALQLFISPGEIFRALKDQPAAWGAIALGAIAMSLTALATPLEVWEAGIRQGIARAGGTAPVEPAQMARFTRMGSAIAVLVVSPLMATVQAAFFSAIFLFGLGFEGRFRQYLAVTAHAGLVVAVSGVVLLPIRVLALDPRLSPNLGTLVPFVEEGLIARWLGYLDLFGLWSFALVGLGAAVMDGRGRAGFSVAVAVGAAALVFLLVASFTG